MSSSSPLSSAAKDDGTKFVVTHVKPQSSQGWSAEELKNNDCKKIQEKYLANKQTKEPK